MSIGFLFVFFSVRATAAQDPGGKATLFFAPRSATILEGTTFDVSVYLDTGGNNINAVELHLKFSPEKLAIVNPSGGKSFITLWIAPPTFSNTKGTVSFSGIVPNGITTASGLITTLTFQAKETGAATIEVLSTSRVLLNDGAGTQLTTQFGKGVFTIAPRPPEGVKVFSETHPFEDKWYNNNSPAISWEKDEGVKNFSFILDSKPLTIPDNVAETSETLTAYADLPDGLWFFHIKGEREKVWGATTHFKVRVDTTPPASFTPELEIIRGATDRALVSFFTTDALSGLDHYEVGLMDKKSSPLVSPVFVVAESPYQLPSFTPGELRVVVRAMDRAGNVTDAALDVTVPVAVVSFFKRHLVAVYGITVALVLVVVVIHYLLRHRIIATLRKIVEVLARERKSEEEHQKLHEHGLRKTLWRKKQ